MKFTLFFLALSLYSNVYAQSDFYPQKEIENFIMKSSMAQVNYIEGLDIEISKFETGKDPEDDVWAREFLEGLPLVNKSSFNRFKDLFDGSTLGVFFSRHNSYYNVKVDTMLLSSEADSWTIAHELSHALIDRERHKFGVVREEDSFKDLANSKEDYEESMSMYRNFGRFLNSSYGKRAYLNLKTWTSITINLLDTFELEEVKIERALRGMYKAGKGEKFNKISFDRSHWYALRNCEKAVDKTEHALSVVDFFIEIADSDSKELIGEDLMNYRGLVAEAAENIKKYCELQ